MPDGGVIRRLAHPAFAAAAVRVMLLPVSVVCGLLGTHLTIRSLGPAPFGVVSLILTLQLIFTFLDLGTGAAVLNEAARFKVQGDRARLMRTWNGSRRIAQRACAAFFVVAAGLAALHVWPVVLGVPHTDVDLAVTVVAFINVVGRPATLALGALQGFGHSVAVVLLQVSIPIVSLVVVAVGAALDAPLVVFAASLTTGQLVCGTAALAIVSRRYRLPVAPFGRWRTDEAKPSLRNQAGPMLVINLVAPLGIGLDRVALAHLATPLALASYALVAQLLQPVFSLSATLTESLWGDFSRKRHGGNLSWEALRRPALLVGLGALICGAGFAALTPWVARLLAGDAIPIGYGVSALAGGVGLLTLSLSVPGSLMTSARGLATQAKVLVGSVALNLTVTLAMAHTWGVAAPLAGSIVGLLVQFVILAKLSRRYLMSSVKEPTR